MRPPVHQAGFSLIEVLVAFSIMALSLGVLYQSLGGSVRGVSEADHYTRAVLLAESVLSKYDYVPPEGLGAEGKSPDGFTWSLHSSPLAPLDGRLDAWRLHGLTVVISWGEPARERSFHLFSVRPEIDPALFDVNSGRAR